MRPMTASTFQSLQQQGATKTRTRPLRNWAKAERRTTRPDQRHNKEGNKKNRP